MIRFRIGVGLATLALVTAVAAFGMAQAGSAAPRVAAKPLVIGISLSLSGDFSDPGKAAMRGYQLWAAQVNAHGGVLGRQVQLKIVDDAQQPQPGRHELPEPDHPRPRRPRLRAVLDAADGAAARVAYRYHYAFLEPAGGGPAVFARAPRQRVLRPAGAGRSRAATRSSSTSSRCRSRSGRRPRPIRRWTTRSRRRSPTACAASSRRPGIKTVFKTIYPPETTDLTPIMRAGGRRQARHGGRRGRSRRTRTRRSRR